MGHCRFKKRDDVINLNFNHATKYVIAIEMQASTH